MNLAEHQLYLRNSVGNLLTIIPDGNYASLDYALKVNEPGVLEVTLPGDFDANLLMIDGQFEVYRAYGGGSMRLEGDTGWFIRKITRQADANRVKTIHITAYSALHLMQRRIIPYVAGSSYAEKVGMPWDDMLKEIVYENYGPGASYAGASYGDDPARNLEPWLTVESYFHYGASFITTHSFPWREVLNTLQDIINEVRNGGNYCTFDVVRVGPAQYEFRVFVGPRGNDHSAGSASPVIVSEERFNLTSPSLEHDWQEEKNFIYATGQGQEANRVVLTAQDDARIGISPFNRQEFNRDSRQVYIPESLQSEADAALEELRPRKAFTGSIAQTEGCLYGVHWGWGDIVTAEYEGLSFDCHVEAVVVSIDANGTEVVTGQLRSVSDV